MTEIEQLPARVAVEARKARSRGWASLPEPATGLSLPTLLAELRPRMGDGGFAPAQAF
ncbi:hypothetical protein ACIGO6_21750 [Streptomyces sp. NPDC053750]|uniref:hypothetical protein n=1 Tax=Streptomyces sp. NPDC053750 TaxID=3365714 RepID=UPI0037D75524